MQDCSPSVTSEQRELVFVVDETQAVVWGEAQACYGLAVLLGGVTRIALPSIVGIVCGEGGHKVIAEGLGQDRCCGYVCKACISLHLAAERDVESRIETIAVYEQMVGPYGELFYGPLHRLERGFEDVDAVDLLGAHLGNSPRNGIVADVVAHDASLLVAHLLGVVQEWMVVVGRQDYGRRKYGPCQTAAPGLVATRLEAIFTIGYFEHSGTKITLLLRITATIEYLCPTMKQQKTDILRQPIPTLFLSYGVLLALLTLRALRAPLGVEVSEGVSLSPVGEWINGSLGGVMGTVVSVGSIFFGSVIVTRIIGRYALSVIRSMVPLVLFVVSLCGIVFPVENPALLAALLMVVHATELMINSFRRSEQFGYVMRAAFWTALAALLVPHFVVVVVLLPIQWMLWQRSPREMFAGVLLLTVPLLMASFCWWVAGESPLWVVSEWWRSLCEVGGDGISLFVSLLDAPLRLALFVLHTLLTLGGIATYIGSYGSMRLRARKGHLYFILLYLVGIAMLLCGLSPVAALAISGFASVPMIYTFYVRHTGLVSALIYLALIALPVVDALRVTIL